MLATSSLLNSLLSLPEAERAEAIAALPNEAAAALLYDWQMWARPCVPRGDGSYGGQLQPPGEWRVWLVLAGRGYGKTRTGAEWVRGEVESGRRGRIALVAPTAADVRDVMVEGESGLLAISPPWNRPMYEPSKRRLTWPNGALATTYSADEPERLRGPQHDGAWCDEPASWRFGPDAWDMLMFGLRLGSDPRAIVTGTPKPVKLIRDLVASPTTAVTRGNTRENAANLAPAFIEHIIRKYEGTRIGLQEIDAQILDDNPGALWKRAQIDELRVVKAPDLARVVVAVDPAVTAGEGSDETGIIVCGRGAADGHGYVLDDLSLRGTPLEWARAVVTGYHKHKADCVVAEVNQGGDLVEATIRMVDPNIPFKAIHASRGKLTRAEPVAAIYEQGRSHHVGVYPALEDQQCNWTQGDPSPDRMDALVHGMTELLVIGAGQQWGLLDW